MKRAFAGLAGLALAFGVFTTQASAAVLVQGEDNEIFLDSFENLYDSQGNFKSPTADPVVGDHLVGIVNIQNIDVNGTTNWFSGPQSQLTGIFAQQIIEVKNDPVTGILHLTLGNPDLTTFTRGADSFATGLAEGEMFRFYLQEGPGTTVFESNGTLANDVARATDGNLYISFGLDETNGAGVDGVFGTGDDTGYAYSHPVLGLNPTGEAWGALQVVVNNTGYPFFVGLNDVNETEIGGTWLLTDMVFSTEFELNRNLASPWEFANNDPAIIHPFIPEVSTLWMLGMGFSGLGVIGRRKFQI